MSTPQVSDLRIQISDVPRQFPSNSDAPDTVGIADGVRTVFFTRFPNFVPASLVVLIGTPPATPPGPPVYVAAASTSYALSGSQITFSAPPTAGGFVATQYQATYFSDAALNTYLTNAAALQTDFRSILKQAQFDLIDVILGDIDKWVALTEGDYKRDPAAVMNALIKLKGELRKDLTGDPRAGRDIPAFATGTNSFARYDVQR
jgi:hypothetical protein